MFHYLLHPAAGIVALLSLGLLVLKVWALVDCITRPASAFELHNKLTKVVWLVILVVAVLLNSALGLLGIAGTIAAIVYLVDVRPALSGAS